MSEQEILACLKEAYACTLRRDVRGYTERMRQAGTDLNTLPQTHPLRGEWLLVSTFEHMNDLDTFCLTLRQAANLIGGRSRVLPGQAVLIGHNPFAGCNPIPGYADENAEKIEQAEKLFFQLTGGGRGTALCYRAQLALYRGELAKAHTLAEQALRLSARHGQELICLRAGEVLAGVAKHRHDFSLWQQALAVIKPVKDSGQSRDSRVLAQLICCNLEMALGLVQSVPRWVREGSFDVIPTGWGFETIDDTLPASVFVDAVMMRMEYLFNAGQPAQSLAVADMLAKVYQAKNTVIDAYLAFFRTGCYWQLGDAQRMRETLDQGMAVIAPDKLWLIAAEFAPPFGQLLYERAARCGPDVPGRIREIGEDFWEKLRLLREGALKSAPAGLTAREQEVVALLIEGKKNAEIAAALHISVRTVRDHLESVYRKYHINRRMQLPEALQKNALELAFWIKNT